MDTRVYWVAHCVTQSFHDEIFVLFFFLLSFLWWWGEGVLKAEAQGREMNGAEMMIWNTQRRKKEKRKKEMLKAISILFCFVLFYVYVCLYILRVCVCGCLWRPEDYLRCCSSDAIHSVLGDWVTSLELAQLTEAAGQWLHSRRSKGVPWGLFCNGTSFNGIVTECLPQFPILNTPWGLGFFHVNLGTHKQ